MIRVGKICPNCKKEINYNSICFDADGNVLCSSCNDIVFPVNEKSFLAIQSKIPVKEENSKYYTSYGSDKEFKLPIINIAK